MRLARECVADEPLLVPTRVPRPALGEQAALQPLVGLRELGVAAQRVAEPEVAAPLVAAVLDQVDDDLARHGRALAEAQFAGAAVGTGVLVAERKHPLDRVVGQVERRDPHDDVDRRLGGEPLDCRAAHVLDGDGQVAESNADRLRLGGEARGPARVVLGEARRLHAANVVLG